MMKLLLVDDEEEFVKALAERLELRGINPRMAFSGEQALQMVQDEVPDVMVLDLRMPGIDGLKVLDRIKRFHPQVRIIILTGHGSDSDRQAAFRLGAFEYLQKPVDISELVRIFKRAETV